MRRSPAPLARWLAVIGAVTGAMTAPPHPAAAATTAVTLAPGEAATRILAALAEWGYRDG